MKPRQQEHGNEHQCRHRQGKIRRSRQDIGKSTVVGHDSPLVQRTRTILDKITIVARIIAELVLLTQIFAAQGLVFTRHYLTYPSSFESWPFK
jgi:hypothetical protein